MSFALRLSLGLNVALLAAVAVIVWRDQANAPLTATSPLPARSLTAPTRAEPVASEASSKSSERKLDSAAMAQFERMGISRDVLVNVLLEDLNRRSSKRVLELQKQYAPKSVPERAYVELSRQSDAERVHELKEALGEDGYRAWDKEQKLKELNLANNSGVPMNPEETERAYQLQKEFDEKNEELQMALEDGVADRADVGALQSQAQQTLDRELEKLLGRERFNELRGNVDPTVEVAREYGDLNPTADQAKAVILAEQNYHTRERDLTQRLSENPADTASITAELKALRDDEEENLRRIFGPEAYDNMKRQNDPTYKTLKQYADAWELNDREIQPVYDTLHTFEQQAERTRTAAEMSESAGQRVNWREIDAAIEQARQKTESSLQNLIGAERLRRLKQNGLLGM